MLEQIFVVVLPGKHDLPLSPRLTTAQSPELGRCGAGRAHKQIRLVPRSANGDAIQLVLFLVHQIVGRGAEDVPMEPVRSLGGVFDRIEQRAVVGGPSDRHDLFDAIRQQPVAAQILDPQRELPKAGDIRGIGQQVGIVAHNKSAQAQELVPLGQLIEIEDDFFLGRIRFLTPAAVDWILLRLHRA